MSTQNEISDLLAERILRPSHLARAVHATVAFLPAGAGPVALRLREGRMHVLGGMPAKIDTRIYAEVSVMREVVAGRMSGVTAFLQGRLRVRGNLALALILDSLFDEPERPVHFPKARFTQAMGIRTFYLEAGEGEPVVLLHGLGATCASMLPTLEALSRRYRVIAPDNPGFGETEKPFRPYHAAFFARWLNAFLDETGIDRAVFVGNSMGGRIALEMGIRFPGRTRGLVLLTPSMAWKRFRRFVPLARVLLPELACVPLRLPRSQVMGALKTMFSKPSRLEQAWYDAAVDEFLRVFRDPRGRVGFFSAARQIYLEESFGEKGFWERLKKIEQPALFIWGRHDRLVPAKFARYAEQAVPHARSVILPDCGHVPQFELPIETHRLIENFLEDPALQ